MSSRMIPLLDVSNVSERVIRNEIGAKSYKQVVAMARANGEDLGTRPATQRKRAFQYFAYIINTIREAKNEETKRENEAAKAAIAAKKRAEKEFNDELKREGIREAAKQKKRLAMALEKVRRRRSKDQVGQWDMQFETNQTKLLQSLNEYRTAAGKKPLGSLEAYKKVFGAKSIDKVIQIAQRLSKTQMFYDLTNLVFREILQDNIGRSISISAVLDIRVDGKLKKKRVQREYHIPSTGSWDYIDSALWDWMDSARWMVDLDSPAFLSYSIPVSKKTLEQAYLDGGAHCVFDAIEQKIDSLPADKNRAAIKKRIAPLRIKYAKGIPDGHLQSVCDKLEIRLVLHDAFGEVTKEIRPSNQPRLNIEFWNNRADHLSVVCAKKDVTLIETQGEMNLLKRELEEKGEPPLFKELKTGPFKLMTPMGTYMLKMSYMDAFDSFEKVFEGCRLNSTLPVSRFIEAGVRQTQSARFGDIYNGYIDQRRSYTQHSKCKFYEGFLGKVTDFRKTDKVVAVGFYHVVRLDWSKASTVIKKIQAKFKMWYAHTVMFSPVIKFLESQGVEVCVSAGCWGQKIDFEFPDEMLEKDGEDGLKVARYSRWVGCASRMSEADEFKLKCKMEFAEHIAEGKLTSWQTDFDFEDKDMSDEELDELMNGEGAPCQLKTEKTSGTATFRIPKVSMHLAHIAGGIYGYQQLNLLEQLLEMKLDSIVEVRVDGIKFRSHEFKLLPTFRHIDKDEYIVDGQPKPLQEPSLYFLGNNGKYKGPLPTAEFREHTMVELWQGPGGCGKTHINLIDTGLQRLLYVAPSHKLERAKAVEYGVSADVLANVLGLSGDDKGPNLFKISQYKKAYNTILVDEVSMMSKEDFDKLIKYYSGVKLIFCGDLGYQLPPIMGTELTADDFKCTKTLEVNRRCKCPILQSKLDELRIAIKAGDGGAAPTQLTGEIENYNAKDDLILVHTHNTKDTYSGLPGDKFRVFKNTKEHSNGDIVFEDLGENKCKRQHAFTTHSIQGETVTGTLYIHTECTKNNRLFYTALSRAQYWSQIRFIGNIEATEVSPARPQYKLSLHNV